MDEPVTENKPALNYLDLLIPLLCFGGPLLTFGLISAGLLPLEAQSTVGAAGPFIGSILLGAYAYRLPRRDIVALVAPVYALIMFVFPTEMAPNLILELLFAVTMLALLIRLKMRFSQPKPKEDEYFEDEDETDEEEPRDEDLP